MPQSALPGCYAEATTLSQASPIFLQERRNSVYKLRGDPYDVNPRTNGESPPPVTSLRRGEGTSIDNGTKNLVPLSASGREMRDVDETAVRANDDSGRLSNIPTRSKRFALSSETGNRYLLPEVHPSSMRTCALRCGRNPSLQRA